MYNLDARNRSLKDSSFDSDDFFDHDRSFFGCGKGCYASSYDSAFPFSHDTYNGIYAASDGNVYYVLSSASKDQGGKMYCFEPSRKKISLCGDLTEICGEKDSHAIPQGKSHVTFIEFDGKLFFGTHIGYYDMVNGMETMGTPPPGYEPYPGGHILSYDLVTKSFIDYGVVPEKEGVLTMNMDVTRGIIYGITWPTGYFFRYDVRKRDMKNFGPVSHGGENGKGNHFRVLCRSIAINPKDGIAYFSTSEGNIMKCSADADELGLVGEKILKKDYFGHYDPSTPGHMGYNWRQIFWHEPSGLFYGIHGNSGYLFSFNPNNNDVALLQRLTSVPSRKSGMYDQFSYGYLGFAIGLDNRTIYYLTGAPVFEDGKRILGKDTTGRGEARGLEHLHLVTYNIYNGNYRDHGPILLQNGQGPLYVNSIALGSNGLIYFLGRITEDGNIRTDLISIQDPLEN